MKCIFMICIDCEPVWEMLGNNTQHSEDRKLVAESLRENRKFARENEYDLQVTLTYVGNTPNRNKP
jgi:hypothetical protein